MKLMKRLAAVVLGVALLCPMTAYAAQSQEALELYKAVEARNQNMTDMNAFYDFKMKMSGSLFENEGIGPVDMRLEMNMKMNHIQDPSQMRYMAYCRMTVPESEPITYSMYYLDGYIYMDMLGHGRHDEPGPGVIQGIRCAGRFGWRL